MPLDRRMAVATDRLTMLLCLFATTFAAWHSAAAEPMTAEEEVWALEEAYYQHASNNDPAAYLTLFHDKVIGWPALDRRPKGKEKVSQWIGMVHANPDEKWRYEIERLAIQSFGDVVVVHYRLRDYFVSARTGEETRSQDYRIAHTWLKRDGRWQIVSGMGGKFN